MRGILGWLLDNPKRFVATVLGAVLAVVLVTLGLSDPPPPVQATPGPVVASAAPAHRTQPTPPGPTPADTVTVTETPREPPPAPREVLTAARAWVGAWLDVTRPARTWQQAMAAHSTASLAHLMRTVPQRVIPRTRIERASVRQASASYALVSVRLADGERLGCSLVLEPDGWKVTQVTTGPPGAR